MHLQQAYLHGVWSYYGVFGVVFFTWRKLHIAIFAGALVKSQINSPVEATVRPKTNGSLA